MATVTDMAMVTAIAMDMATAITTTKGSGLGSLAVSQATSRRKSKHIE